MLDTLLEIVAQWGYMGAFVVALLAGSIVPLSSEIVLTALLAAGLDPVSLILWATAGNTLGGMTCYWIGRLGKMEWIHRYFGVKEETLQRVNRKLQGRGAFMAVFSCLPYVGEAVAIALGLLRSNAWLTTAAMFVGRLLRYVLVYLLYKGAIHWV